MQKHTWRNYEINISHAFFVLGINQLFALATPELVNSQTMDMTSVKYLTISYSSDNIFLFESNDDSLVLKEFMTIDNRDYYAKIDTSPNAITINSGMRPPIIKTRIEIYIPKTFTDNLNVNLRSGNLTGNYDMNHERINLSVSSGNITIDELSGNNITVKNGSGNINIENCQGKIDTDVRSGNIGINNFSGEGTFDVRSGNIDLAVNNIFGDISLFSDSGSINVILEENVSFNLNAEVRSGNINLPDKKSDSNTKLQHTIGSNPKYNVSAKCDSGNITIR